MTVNRYRYYLGRAGALRQLPGFPRPPTLVAGEELIGGLHRSMTGRTSQDHLGTSRFWEVQWDRLTEAQASQLQTTVRRTTIGDQYLVDLRNRNLIAPDVSEGGCGTRSSESFDVPDVVNADTYTRTVASGSWGISDIGIGWTFIQGTAADLSVASGVGRHAVGTVSAPDFVVFSRGAQANFDYEYTVATSALATGSLQATIMAGRFIDVNNYYQLWVMFNTTAQITLELKRVQGGVVTSLLTFTPGLTHVANSRYTVRFQGIGPILKAKIGLEGAVPADWTFSVSDPTGVTAAGQVGMMSFLNGGNTNTLPVTFSYDNFKLYPVTSPGFVRPTTMTGWPTELVGELEGYQSWSGASPGSVLWSGTEVPTIAGSYYVFSAYVSGSGTIRAIADPYDEFGTAQTRVDSGSDVVLSSSWTRISWTYTPAASAATVMFGLLIKGTNPTTLNTTGWSVQIDEPLAGWVHGSGCPKVSLSAFQRGYPIYPYRSVSMTFREA